MKQSWDQELVKFRSLKHYNAKNEMNDSGKTKYAEGQKKKIFIQDFSKIL